MSINIHNVQCNNKHLQWPYQYFLVITFSTLLNWTQFFDPSTVPWCSIDFAKKAPKITVQSCMPNYLPNVWAVISKSRSHQPRLDWWTFPGCLMTEDLLALRQSWKSSSCSSLFFPKSLALTPVLFFQILNLKTWSLSVSSAKTNQTLMIVTSKVQIWCEGM